MNAKYLQPGEALPVLTHSCDMDVRRTMPLQELLQLVEHSGCASGRAGLAGSADGLGNPTLHVALQGGAPQLWFGNRSTNCGLKMTLAVATIHA